MMRRVIFLILFLAFCKTGGDKPVLRNFQKSARLNSSLENAKNGDLFSFIDKKGGTIDIYCISEEFKIYPPYANDWYVQSDGTSRITFSSDYMKSMITIFPGENGQKLSLNKYLESRFKQISSTNGNYFNGRVFPGKIKPVFAFSGIDDLGPAGRSYTETYSTAILRADGSVLEVRYLFFSELPTPRAMLDKVIPQLLDLGFQNLDPESIAKLRSKS
ncbi:hypothetical protein ACE5IS_17890 [Leptospira wolffii]|uniref:Lipoprotein n=1 Tax=Leptospira wolffii TaxID=409998 RepID=A0ABV5BSJ5_9LEPT